MRVLPFQQACLLPHLVIITCSISGRSFTRTSPSSCPPSSVIRMRSPQLYSPSKQTMSNLALLLLSAIRQCGAKITWQWNSLQITQAGKTGFFKFLPTSMQCSASKIVRKPNSDFSATPFSLQSSRTFSPSKQLEQACPVSTRFTNYWVQCPWLPISGFSFMSISPSISSAPLVSTTEQSRAATPWLLVPMYSSLEDQTAAKAEGKSLASTTTVRRLPISTLVAPLGGKARCIFSLDLTFQSMLAMAATRHTSRRVSSLQSLCLEHSIRCFRKQHCSAAMMPHGPPSICLSPQGVCSWGERMKPWLHDLGRIAGEDWKTTFLSLSASLEAMSFSTFFLGGGTPPPLCLQLICGLMIKEGQSCSAASWMTMGSKAYSLYSQRSSLGIWWVKFSSNLNLVGQLASLTSSFAFRFLPRVTITGAATATASLFSSRFSGKRLTGALTASTSAFTCSSSLLSHGFTSGGGSTFLGMLSLFSLRMTRISVLVFWVSAMGAVGGYGSGFCSTLGMSALEPMFAIGYLL